MFLTVKEIRKHFGEGDSRVEVLNGIDAEIEKGEICVLLGPSGSGKTLLGSAASGEGLVNVYRGTGKVLLAPVGGNC